MTELYPSKTDASERTYYEPVLARIVGTSQYRDDEYRLEGIEGFWSAAKVEVAQKVRDGAIAWFSLATKPKTGPNAKPGSMYRDITDIKPATDEQKASYSPETQTLGSYPAKEPANGVNGAHSAGNGNVWDERDRQIKLGMAFNNLTTMLAAVRAEVDRSPERFNEWANVLELENQWWKWFNEASQGKPLTPVEPAAKEMGAVEQEEPDDTDAEPVQQEIEELPW